MFASAQDEPRSRRPTDVVLAIVSALVVVIAALMSKLLTQLEESISEVVADVPSFFDTLWRLTFWAPVVWAVVLILAAVVRGRGALTRDLLAAPALSFGLAAIVAGIVMDDGAGIGDLLFDVDGPPYFPPGLLALATAVTSTASPHLSRPFRNFGRWLIAFQLVGTIMLGVALPSGASAAIAVGLFAAATVHLAVGSPGGRPTASRIRLALADLGVRVDDLAPLSMQPEGVVLFEGSDAEGPLVVKVYGRDAWDAQLLANLWRLVWYRGVERTVRLSRVELVEHEAFVTLLAERAGARVSHLVTAGSAGRSDALVVVRPLGDTIASQAGAADTPSAIDEAAVSGLWAEISRLHDAGITHGRIDLDRVVVIPDGTLALGDLSSATVTGEPEDAAKDRAQVLTLSILLLGEERGLAVARAFGDDTVVSVLPYLQEAAMPPLIRATLDDRKVELDNVRTRVSETLGADEQRLIKLRRVTWGSLLNLALLGFAAFAMISLLGDIDLDEFIDELTDADWWWLALALVLAQMPRIPSAMSTMGSINRPLPLGPLVTKEFAICYVNLAIPSSAARVAINIRFLQRFGVDATTAVSAGVIDSVSGFVVQIFLFVALFFWSDVDFGITLDTSDLDGLLTIALIVVAVLILLVVLVCVIPAWRRHALDVLRKARAATAVLRNPTKALQLFGGNLLSQVLFAVAFGACVRAFGEELPLSTLVLINTVVTLFAGLLPIPGGMGVSEAGLTLGLTSAGLSSSTAFAIALAYRFASFYLPPVWGYFCYRWLIRRRYL
jgi:uncharacterized membrane protein YbhN (UPF0104 family)